jgi:general secretion pathway protein B
MPAPPKPKPDPVAKAPATQAAQAAPAAVPLLGDLPEGLRREIPPLAISGSVYSANPAQRLLLVNNQVLSQGSQAAPGVNLEEIHAKSSVFSFRGTRFRVAH